MNLTARRIGGWIIANFLWLIGVVRRRRRMLLQGEYILSIYFHKPTRSQFERCVKWLKKYQFSFLSVPDIEALIESNHPFPKGGVVIAVDDGWQSNEKNVIEVANAYGIPITIFVATAPIEEGAFWWSYVAKARECGVQCVPISVLKQCRNEERISAINQVKQAVPLERMTLTEEQVKRAANSTCITIGGHTHTHPILINCDDKQAYEELKVSKNKLEALTGKELRYFAYPNGDYGSREIEMLRHLNYKLAFSTMHDYLCPESLKFKYELPRFMFIENASFAENICRILGVLKPKNKQSVQSPFFNLEWKKETTNKSIVESNECVQV